MPHGNRQSSTEPLIGTRAPPGHGRRFGPSGNTGDLAKIGIGEGSWARAYNQAAVARPLAPNLKAREWFQEARFGLFIHWGEYAVAGEGEWVMHQKRLTIPEYARDLPPAFNPVKDDPAAWVAMAKAAGTRYDPATLDPVDTIVVLELGQ